MAEEDIVQRIVLEGAEQVERDLARLGDTGQQAFEQLSESAARAGKTLDQIDTGEITKALEGISDTAGEVFNRVKKLASGSGNIFDNIHPGVLRDSLRDLGVDVDAVASKLKALSDQSGGFDKIDPTKAIEDLKELTSVGQRAFNVLQEEVAKVGGFDKLDFNSVTQKLQTFGIDAESALKAVGEQVAAVGGDFGGIDTSKAVESLEGFKLSAEKITDGVKKALGDAADLTGIAKSFKNISQDVVDSAVVAENALKSLTIAERHAFEKLEKSADEVGGFKNLRLEDVTKQLAEVGIVGEDSISRVAAAVDKAGISEKLITGFAKVNEELGLVGVRVFQELREEAAKLGVDVDRIPFEKVSAKLAELGITGVAATEKVRDALRGLNAGPSAAGRVVESIKKVGESAQGIGEKTKQGVDQAKGFLGSLSAAFDALGNKSSQVMTVISKSLGLDTATSNLIKIGASIGSVVAGLGFLAAAWLRAGADAQEFATKIGDAAAKAGVAVDRLNNLRVAFNKAGGSTEDFFRALEAINKEADLTRVENVKKIADEVRELQKAGGGDLRAAAGMQRLRQIAQGFGPDAKAAKDALEQFQKSAERVGGGIKARVVQPVQDADKEFQKFAKRIASISNEQDRFRAVQSKFGFASQQLVDTLADLGKQASLDEADPRKMQELVRQAREAGRAATEASEAWRELKFTIGQLDVGADFDKVRASLTRGLTGEIQASIDGFARLGRAIRQVMQGVTFDDPKLSGIEKLVATGIGRIIQGWREAKASLDSYLESQAKLSQQRDDQLASRTTPERVSELEAARREAAQLRTRAPEEIAQQTERVRQAVAAIAPERAREITDLRTAVTISTQLLAVTRQREQAQREASEATRTAADAEARKIEAARKVMKPMTPEESGVVIAPKSLTQVERAAAATADVRQNMVATEQNVSQLAAAFARFKLDPSSAENAERLQEAILRIKPTALENVQVTVENLKRKADELIRTLERAGVSTLPAQPRGPVFKEERPAGAPARDERPTAPFKPITELQTEGAESGRVWQASFAQAVEQSPPPELPTQSGAAAAGQQAGQQFVQGFSLGVTGGDLTAAQASILNAFTTIPQMLEPVFAQIDQRLRGAFSGAGLQQIASGLGAIVEAGFGALAASVQTAEGAIVDAINRIIAKINEAIDRMNQLRQSGGGGGGGNAQQTFSSGGHFRGRPGKDTNLAWLTDDEFVMRVAAVKKYGLAMMHSINQGKFAKGGQVKDGLPAFQDGGSPSSVLFFREAGNQQVQTEILNLIVEVGRAIIKTAWRVYGLGVSEGIAQERARRQKVRFFSQGGLVGGSGGSGGGQSFSEAGGFASGLRALADAGGFVGTIDSRGIADALTITAPGFARGGLFGSGAPHDSESPSRSLTLVLEGQRFPGLQGPVNVIDKLEKHAVQKKATRISPSPSWVR